jgi:putative ABC transport system ATP-binding protein
MLDLAADGTPVVWVTHDLDQARRLAEHVIVVRGGRVVHAGPVGELDAGTGDLEALLSDPGGEDDDGR